MNEVGDNDQVVTGTSEAGSKITVKAGEVEFGSAIAKENGQFSVSIPYQSAGTVLMVTASDDAGNESEVTEVIVKDKISMVNEVSVMANLPSPQIAGTSISLKAKSQGSREPEYRFFVRDEKGNLTILQEYGSSDTASWKPNKAGTYTIIVHAKDKSKSGTNYSYEARTQIVYKVNPGTVTSVSVQSELPSPQVAGMSMTFKAASQGSIEPEYRFYVRDGKGNISILQEYGSSDIAVWTPTKPGTYTIIVHAKDKIYSGSSSNYQARTEMVYKVNPAKVTGVTVEASIPSPQLTGTPISFKTETLGSPTPEYRFLIRDEKGNLTTLQEYGSTNTITWVPTKAGTYTVIVHAKDQSKSGANYNYESRAEMLYQVE